MTSISAIRRARRAPAAELLGDSVETVRLLYSVATALSTSLNLDETLRSVLKGLRECIAFDAATIFLLDPRRRQLTVKAALGVTVALQEVRRFRVGEGVVGWVVEHNRSALIEDAARDPRYQATGRPRQGAMLAVPLRSREQVIGALVLVRRQRRPFSEESRQLAEAIAGQAAIAIEHARVYETERHFRRRAEALLAASRAASESRALDGLMDSAVAQLEQLLQADRCMVLLPDAAAATIVGIRDRQGQLPVGFDALLGRRLAHVPWGHQLRRAWRPLVLQRAHEDEAAAVLLWKRLRSQTLLVVPIRWRRRLRALLLCLFARPRTFVASELTLIQDVSAQFAEGVERLKLQRDVVDAQNQIAIVSERNRIARDLHDGIAQYVYSLGLNLEHVRGLLPADPQSARQTIAQCIEQTNHVLAELRTFIYQLRPIIMREKEIGQWIRDLCQQFERATGLRLTATVGATGGRELSAEISIALFRIIQEALANIYHHAAAGEAAVELSFGPSTVRLVVQDRGRGFDPARSRRRSIARGQGLANIRERVQALGGVVTIDSKPGAGTRLVAAIPYQRPPAFPQTRPHFHVA